MASGPDYCYFLWRFLPTEGRWNYIMCTQIPFTQETSCLSHSPLTVTQNSHCTPLSMLHPFLKHPSQSLPPPSPIHASRPNSGITVSARLAFTNLPFRMNCFFISISMAVDHIPLYYTYILSLMLVFWDSPLDWRLLKGKNHTSFNFTAPVPGMQVFDLWNILGLKATGGMLKLTNIISHTSNKNRSLQIYMCLFQKFLHDLQVLIKRQTHHQERQKWYHTVIGNWNMKELILL